jgi:quinoprotein glucose dehydrogenase
MPSFPTLAPEHINAIVQYVTKGDESIVATPVSTTPPPFDAQYRFTGHHKFLDPDGYPAITPPWGTLNAIDLNTGEYAWKIPLGEYPELAAQGMKNTGSENYGGPVVTAGGLVFIAATNYDKKFRAFDKKTGRLLWETTLPFAANATPATYEIDGRQYIVIAASGAGVLHNQRNTRGPQQGASYIAFALPSASN